MTPAILLSVAPEELELADAEEEDDDDEELPEPHAATPRHMPAAHTAVMRLAAVWRSLGEIRMATTLAADHDIARIRAGARPQATGVFCAMVRWRYRLNTGEVRWCL